MNKVKSILREYQDFTPTTAVYPRKSEGGYLTAGLVGEVGEIYSLIAKFHRDGGDFEDFLTSLESEIGDVMWFIAQFCNYYQFDLEDILIKNSEKLVSRQDRGVLQGSGDER